MMAAAAVREALNLLLLCLTVTLAFGRDSDTSNTNFVIKHEACPSAGYYMKRESIPNSLDAGPCFLCFCSGNGTAFCWETGNKKCDVESHQIFSPARVSRPRRSPISLGEIFVRDASRDFFNKNMPEECKPFESSFSDGCPPADWCVGCTVCDCDANGRWDCHILSFCHGTESKKKIKARKRPSRNPSMKKPELEPKITTLRPQQTKARSAPKNTTKKNTQKKTTTKPKQNKKPVMRTQAPKKVPNTKVKPQIKHKIQPKRRPKQIFNNSFGKFIKKDVAAKKPISLQNSHKINNKKLMNENDTVKLGQKIVKQVMTAVQQMLIKHMEQLNATNYSNKLASEKDCGTVKKRNKRTYNVKSKAVSRNQSKNKSGPKGSRKRKNKGNITISNKRLKRGVLDNEIEKNVIPIKRENTAIIPLVTSATKLEDSKIKGNATSFITTASIPTDMPGPSSSPIEYFKYALFYSNNDTTTEIKNDIEESSTSSNINVTKDTTSNESKTHEVVKNKTVLNSTEYSNIEFTKWYVIKTKTPLVKAIAKAKPTKTVVYNKIDQFTNSQKSKLAAMLMNDNFKNIENQTDLKQNNLSGLQNVLRSLLFQRNSNITQHNAMKYVTKFFKDLFSKTKTETYKSHGMGKYEDHTIDILCHNFGPCKLTRKKKYRLKPKIKQLNSETEKILRSMKIVKGLLHLLELPNFNKGSIHDDTKTLNYILKRTYDYEKIPLTVTQKTQIDYIHKNTQLFVESIKKFSEILKEILDILKLSSKTHTNKNSPRLHKLESKPKNSSNLFIKLKKMLIKYNVIQNSFIKKMYSMIHDFEQKNVSHTAAKNKSNEKDKIIENCSRKIMSNLAKLKNLARALNSNRRKRNVGKDSTAMDYLLTLMEYMMKQNQPLDTESANDGIDFLIDAIKNAPDVKPNKKKILEYIPVTKKKTVVDVSDTSDDESADTNKLSKEIKNFPITNNTSHNDIVTESAGTNKVNTPSFYSNGFDESNKLLNDNVNDNTKEIDVVNNQTYHFESVTDQSKDTEKTGFDKFESNIEVTRLYELYSNDNDDEGIISATLNSTDKNDQKSIGVLKPGDLNNTDDSEFQDSNSDKRVKLEWIDDSFEKESGENVTTSTITTPVLEIHTTSSTEKSVDISSLTKELIDESEDKRKKLSLTPDEVMYKKQMDLMNSLDYGTERSDFEDVDSKEDAKSEDVFSSYFA